MISSHGWRWIGCDSLPGARVVTWAGGGKRVEVDEGGVEDSGVLGRPVGGDEWRRGLRVRGKSEGERREKQRKGGGREEARKAVGFHAEENNRPGVEFARSHLMTPRSLEAMKSAR